MMKLGEFLAVIGLIIGIALLGLGMDLAWQGSLWAKNAQGGAFCIWFYWECFPYQRWTLVWDYGGLMIGLGLILSIISAYWIGYTRE